MASNIVSDDLDFNPFYTVLRNKFKAVFEEAQTKCCLICIPHSSTVQGIQVDKNFVEMHIVKPSPYFKGIYVTTDKNNTGSLSIEQNIIETGQGYPDNISVHILAEELGYSKKYKPYRILLIDRPLTGFVVDVGKVQSCGPPEHYIIKTTLSECQEFLDSIPECQQVVQSDVEQAIKSFVTNYMILQGFINDAAEKIRKMHTDMSEKVLQSLPTNLCCDQRIIENVCRAVESVILNRVHSRIFPVISEECRRDNAMLEDKVRRLRKTSHEKVRLDKRFQCTQLEAIEELDCLGSLTTPLDKLACMKATLEKITNTLQHHLSQELGGNLSDVPPVASDDLISLLVSVIIQCHHFHLPSDIFFIEHFHWPSSSNDNISYCFVTFKAAVQFILSLDISPVEQVNSKQHHDDWPETKPMDMEPDSQIQPHLLDHSLLVMAKQVELSTKEFVEASKMSVPPGRSNRQESNVKLEQRRKRLGDLLTSLPDGICNSSYGKQT